VMISSMVLFLSRDCWGVGPVVEAPNAAEPAGGLLVVPVVPGVAVVDVEAG
jgi:hypothetical protein